MEYKSLEVDFQYLDEEKNILIFSDECYNQHEVPAYLYRGHVAAIQPGTRFLVLMDGERYIKLI